MYKRPISWVGQIIRFSFNSLRQIILQIKVFFYYYRRFPYKFAFLKSPDHWNESHHDTMNAYQTRSQIQGLFLVFSPPERFRKTAYVKIRRMRHRFPSISRRSGPSAPTTDKFFVLPACPVAHPSPDDGSLDEFKVNLGHETVLWRARGVGRRRSRATCHREPPGSAGLTLISLLR